ncbi:MAG TPA: DUF6544 family protein [Chthonomonadaceae bacterium]|nr:DUF6544 family protein [Chthonomonadaceae bacterium]
MADVSSLNEFWKSIAPGERIFERGQLVGLPDPARRYLEYAIAPGTRLASAIRLRMQGQIKLRRWLPFTAEQVIGWKRGMIWRATVRMHGIPIRGFDRLINGEGEMQWKILGLLPLVSAAGPDITRSAAGRVAAETVWLPSVLCHEEVTWTAPDSSHAQAHLTVESESVELSFGINGTGQLESVTLKRWGNPEGGAYHYADFGGFAEREGTFDGYTIPTQLRIGWYPGTERFESEGEFFRCQIDHAEFR